MNIIFISNNYGSNITKIITIFVITFDNLDNVLYTHTCKNEEQEE